MTTEKAKATFVAEDLISIPQAAQELRVNFSMIYPWIHNGKI
jgi:hypothetical protein